jgi:cytoskeletal protein CcmA (bactofilin family)
MTRIGPSIEINGEVTSEEDLRVEGCVTGRVLVRNAALVVGRSGRIEADVRGARVTIEGNVRGPVTATERIELSPTASVSGSLSADRVVVVDGARFNGRIDMDRRTIAARLEHYRGAQTRPATP